MMKNDNYRPHRKPVRYSSMNRPANERPPFPSPLFVIGLMVVVLVGYGLFKFSQHMISESGMFVLKQVTVEGNQYVSSEEIIKKADLNVGDKIFQIPIAEITERVTEIPYLNGVSISRSLPSTVIISVQEREPVAYLIDQRSYMIDETGIILLKKPAMTLEDLPLITGLSVPRLLKNRKPLLDALKLVDLIQGVDQDLFHLISEIHIDEDQPARLYLIRGGATVKLGVDDLPKKIYLFSEFVKKDNIINQLESIKLIDLSFNDRVVVTRKS